ncbi:class III lanthionine synthetase LanKC [Mammaliicoccus sciuri]|uniref:class III lanthionine synthetase LanKC n=1 Tax=Mammaliicoccus sciuri TaxID=1296 RepID=UPI0037A2BF82
MDMRYIKYVSKRVPYYTQPDELNNKSNLLVKNIPSTYKTLENYHWVHLINNQKILPEQGWKIHISTTLEEAQNTLDIVSSILFKRNIHFKFVKSVWELTVKNSKYGDRGSSGKFIAIYPQNEQEFLELLPILDKALKGLPKGPYILNDKRWYESNVFFRYGAFAEMYYYESGHKVLAIKNPDGDLVEDLRVPYYTVPDFIKEPDLIKKMDAKVDSELIDESPLDNYEIHEAIHYSNGGGVYLANKKGSEEKVIIKEGRPNSGLDAQGNDAFSRVKNEASILNKLKSTSFPVHIKEHFQAWEHTFIVEEYIEGNSLTTWLATEYPFYSQKNKNIYIKNSIFILEQLIKALDELHNNNIGLGDLQPSNIIINEKLQVRLIDFETASNKNNTTHSGLMTPGFSGSPKMNREQSDWFALLRIARYMFVPIGPVQDISLNILNTHDNWIATHFNEDVLKVIKKIETKCNSIGAKPLDNLLVTNSKYQNKFDINLAKKKLTNTIQNSLFWDNRLIPGDIRQFEMTDGLNNILTGGFGIALTLSRTNQPNKKVDDWIKSISMKDILNMDNGLMTGKTGIATVFLESNDLEKVGTIVDSIDTKNMTDISITSGLSGIGLFLLGLSLHNKFEYTFKKVLDIAEKLEFLLKEDIEIIPFDADIISLGLLNGWSGVSLFFIKLYEATKKSKWLELSEIALEKDISTGVYDEHGLFQLKDTFRIVPYLAGGSAGVGLVIMEYNKVTQKNKWEKELKGIQKVLHTNTFYSCSLFKGTTGILVTANALDLYNNNESKPNVSKVLDTLKLHLLETDNEIHVPGDYCYRLSNDLFSGASGILLVINDIINKTNFSWLPIPNYQKIFE